MAIQSLNSVGGFSVKDGSGDILVIIDSNGNVSTPDLTVTGLSDLGAVGNITITGGSSGYVLSTDGSGTLSWAAPGGGGGNTEITSPMPYYIDSSETYYVTANHQGLFSVPIEIDGTLEVDGILADVGVGISGSPNQLLYNNDGGLSGIPTATYDGSNLNLGSSSALKITGGTNGYVLQTDGTGNLSWTAQTGGGSGGVAGANTQVQFNDAGDFGANAGFTFNKTSGLLTAPYISGDGSNLSNVSVSSATTAGTVTTAAQPNITSTGTLSSLSVSGNANVGGLNISSTVGNYSVLNISGTALGPYGTPQTWQFFTNNTALGGSASFIKFPDNSTQTTAYPGTASTLSLTGNVTGGNIVTSGVVTATGNITAGNLITGGTLSTTGNANIGNIGTAGLITATGNITAGNLITGGTLSTTGNANIGNIGTAGLITATGNIRGANLVTPGVLSVTGNANIGNIGTAGILTATGNITGGNIITGGLLTATGNVTGGNLVTGGLLSVTGNANIGNIGTAGQITATGTITSAGGTNSTAFLVGNSATSNCALAMIPTAGVAGQYAIRDYSTVTADMYFDVSIGGSSNGQFQFRSSSSYVRFAQIDQYGITLPTRPAFRVYGSGTTNNLTTTQNGTGALNSNNWTVDYSQSSALNSTTGVFTAPAAGLYQIDIVGRNSGYSSGISQLAVIKNASGGTGAGGNVMCMIEWAASSSMNHVGGSTIAKLAVNDTLALKVLAGQINFDNNDNWSVAFIG